MRHTQLTAQCVAPQGGQGGEGEKGDSGGGAMETIVTLFPFVLLVVVFYVLLIRPQRKKEKERQSLIAQLKKNDKVVTNGGIFGTVVSARDPWIVLKIDENSDARMKVLKSSVAGLADAFEAGEEGKDGGKAPEKKDGGDKG